MLTKNLHVKYIFPILNDSWLPCWLRQEWIEGCVKISSDILHREASFISGQNGYTLTQNGTVKMQMHSHIV